MNPLQIAIRNDYTIEEIERIVQENGNYINETCPPYGYTALHTAVSIINQQPKEKILHIIHLLINGGADLEAGDNLCYTPLQSACVTLYDIENREELSHIELLLKSGASVKKSGNSRQSPLQLAIISGNIELVRLLLDYGADINEKDYRGRTCLDYVIGNNEFIDILTNGSYQIKEPDT